MVEITSCLQLDLTFARNSMFFIAIEIYRSVKGMKSENVESTAVDEKKSDLLHGESSFRNRNRLLKLHRDPSICTVSDESQQSRIPRSIHRKLASLIGS